MKVAWKLDPYWKVITRLAGAAIAIAALALVEFDLSPVVYMGDDRRDIYGALLTTFGTLLGISYAVTAMIIGFSDRASLSVYVRSKDYPDVALMMRDTNRALALSAVIAFFLMIAEGHAAEPWLLALLLGSASWSLSVLGMAMNRFTTMLHRVAQSHSEEKAKEYENDLADFLSDEPVAPSTSAGVDDAQPSPTESRPTNQ